PRSKLTRIESPGTSAVGRISALATRGLTVFTTVVAPLEIFSVSGGRLAITDSSAVAASATFLSMTLSSTVMVLLDNVGSTLPGTSVLAVNVNVHRLGAL